MNPIYKTKEHQDLVREVMNDRSTMFVRNWGIYTTFFFHNADPINFPGRVDGVDIDDFAENVRTAAAKYLESSESFHQVED